MEQQRSKKKVRFLVTIPSPLHEELGLVAKKHETSINRLCRIILEWGLPRVGSDLKIESDDNYEPRIMYHYNDEE